MNDKVERLKQAVANIAANTGKSEQQVLDELVAYITETPAQRDIRAWKHAASICTDPAEKAVFERLIAERESQNGQ